jgi:hypothetical protein
VEADEGLRSVLAAMNALCPAFITDDLGSVLRDVDVRSMDLVHGGRVVKTRCS